MTKRRYRISQSEHGGYYAEVWEGGLMMGKMSYWRYVEGTSAGTAEEAERKLHEELHPTSSRPVKNLGRL